MFVFVHPPTSPAKYRFVFVFNNVNILNLYLTIFGQCIFRHPPYSPLAQLTVGPSASTVFRNPYEAIHHDHLHLHRRLHLHLYRRHLPSSSSQLSRWQGPGRWGTRTGLRIGIQRDQQAIRCDSKDDVIMGVSMMVLMVVLGSRLQGMRLMMRSSRQVERPWWTIVFGPNFSWVVNMLPSNPKHQFDDSNGKLRPAAWKLCNFAAVYIFLHHQTDYHHWNWSLPTPLMFCLCGFHGVLVVGSCQILLSLICILGSSALNSHMWSNPITRFSKP